MKFLKRLTKIKTKSILVPSVAKPSRGFHDAMGFVLPILLQSLYKFTN